MRKLTITCMLLCAALCLGGCAAEEYDPVAPTDEEYQSKVEEREEKKKDEEPDSKEYQVGDSHFYVTIPNDMVAAEDVSATEDALCFDFPDSESDVFADVEIRALQGFGDDYELLYDLMEDELEEAYYYRRDYRINGQEAVIFSSNDFDPVTTDTRDLQRDDMIIINYGEDYICFITDVEAPATKGTEQERRNTYYQRDMTIKQIIESIDYR